MNFRTLQCLKSLQTLWNRVLNKNLLLVNTVSSGGFMMAGDITAQMIEGKGIDMCRVARMTAIGTVEGFFSHYYYTNLDRIMTTTDLKTVCKKILLDQVLVSPISISFFFYSSGLLEGNTIKETTEELANKFLVVYKADWLIWPPCQFVNFYFLPSAYRVLYMNAITVVYNVFLCYVKHQEVPEKTVIS